MAEDQKSTNGMTMGVDFSDESTPDPFGLARSRSAHEQRIERLTAAGASVSGTARELLGSSLVARLLPSSLTAQEYLHRSTELEEGEVFGRLTECSRCPSRGGRCSGGQHEGMGPVWGEGFEWRRCRRWGVYALDRRLEQSGFPPRLAEKGFDGYRVFDDAAQAVVADCKGWAKRYLEGELDGLGLLLQGDCGVGKSHLLTAVARELIARGVEVRFWDVADLVQQLRNHDDRSTAIREEAKVVPVLVLDDLNVTHATPWVIEQIEIIVNHRWGHKLATLYTSNHDLDRHIAVLGERTVSRILDASVSILLEGVDYRRQG